MTPSQNVTVFTGEKEGNSPISSQLLKPDLSKGPVPRFGKRFVQVLFHALCNAMCSFLNACMPICLVAMTDSTSSINKNIPTYEWTQKGTIISVFIWGNMSTQILSGWLSSRYGGKWILVIINGICSLLLLLLPTVVYNFGFAGIVTSRFLQGFFIGFTNSAVHSLLAKWVPPQEKTTLSTIAASGLTSGCVISIFVSGSIAASWYGWPMVFYALGSWQLLLSLSLAYFSYNSPADHPNISQQELLYINNRSIVEKDNQKLSTPWTLILTSPSFMALALVQCTFISGTYILLSVIPTYFNKVMEFDMQSNSLMTTLPFLIMWFMGYLFSFLTDWFVVKRIFEIGRSRKILISIGFFVPCVALIMIANCDKNDSTKAIILMIIGVGFLVATLAGYMVNHIDLSPNYAGILMGIANQCALMCSGIAVLLMQYVVTDETDPSQWKIVFYSSATIFAFSAIVFDIFGSGKVQHWNDYNPDTLI